MSGQQFEDLDLLARLLAPRRSEAAERGPLIEVLDSAQETSPDDELAARTAELSLEEQELLEGLSTIVFLGKGSLIRCTAAENDWQIKQELPESASLKTSIKQYYGFLNLYTDYFRHVEHTENEMNELGTDIENCSPAERRRKRLKRENTKFDEDHYLYVRLPFSGLHCSDRSSVQILPMMSISSSYASGNIRIRFSLRTGNIQKKKN